MSTRKISTTGLLLALAYLACSVCLIMWDGLFSESFIVLVLGMPWTMLTVGLYADRPTHKGLFLALLLAPIVLNAALLYGIGVVVGRVAGKARALFS